MRKRLAGKQEEKGSLIVLLATNVQQGLAIDVLQTPRVCFLLLLLYDKNGGCIFIFVCFGVFVDSRVLGHQRHYHGSLCGSGSRRSPLLLLIS